MSDPVDFSRLSHRWLYWAPRAGLANPQVSEDRSGREIRFTSDDHSVHLRHTEGWWVMDTTDDRGQLHSNVAKFSTYELVEKYLVWDWSSPARNGLSPPRIGSRLYALGHASDVEFKLVREGIYELNTSEGRAILMEPDATIFSHLIFKSVAAIEGLVSDGV
ncbi:hypothetical protein ABQF33_15885 [Mycolicibacterium sp. XJ2]